MCSRRTPRRASISRSAPASTALLLAAALLASCGGGDEEERARAERSAAGGAAFEQGRAALRAYRVGGPLASRARALEAFEEAARLDPGDAEILAALGEILLEVDRVDEAIPRLREAARLAPAMANARWSLGRALLSAGDLEPALLALDAALAGGVDSADLHHARAVCLEQLDRRDEAAAANMAALERRPTLAAAHLRLSELSKAAGREAEAEARLAQFMHWTGVESQLSRALGAAREASAGPAAITEVARLYFELARAEESLQWSRRAVELDPRSAEAHRVRGLAASMSGRLDEARVHLSEARRLMPDDVWGAVELAFVHLGCGDPAAGTALMDELVAGHPGDVNLLFQAGQFGLELGDEQRALLAFERAAELDPDHVETRLAAGQIHARAGRPDEAEALFRAVLTLAPGHPVALQSLTQLEAETSR